jgi:small nuclear ribonucleoprotein D3
MSVGAPIRLLHEAAGFVVTIELISGDVYKGTLQMVEDNMNCFLHDVIHTAPDGQQVKVDSAYLRGSNILFVSVPDMFATARFLKPSDTPPKPPGKLKRTFVSVKVRKQSHPGSKHDG